MIHYNEDALEAYSLMLSVELAICFNPRKDKNRIVQKVCTHARHRFKGNMKSIVDAWRKDPKAYEHYNRMMTRAGL